MHGLVSFAENPEGHREPRRGFTQENDPTLVGASRKIVGDTFKDP